MAKPADKYPRYDPSRDGNPFYWIQAACKHIRKGHINGQGRRLDPPNLDPLTGRGPIKPL